MTQLIDYIGNTPLVQLQHIGGGRIYAKLEKNNPGGSIKDRVAYYMIREAEKDGRLKKGMTIVEPTSGNTGVGLAWVGRALGYKVIIVMPAGMSLERRRLIQSYGAELLLTTEGGVQGAADKAKEIASQDGYFLPDQFSNPANRLAHYETTGPEIYRDLPEVAGFIAAFGTGGTVSGVGSYLKEKNPAIQVWTAEPAESPLLTEGHAGSHQIQGIGANLIPSVLDQSIIDHTLTVTSGEALEMARRLSQEEGLSVGISSGANVAVALKMAEQVAGPIATVLPDTAEHYYSTALFKDGSDEEKGQKQGK